jgi:RHS repeat-associated protein
LILNDGTNSYIYGAGGLSVEQVSTAGTATFLRHDQQGSTRVITNTTGAVVGTATYDGYGNKTGSTGTTTTPLGYDAQYIDADTGLIYMRARYYDPATGQFMTIDPKVEETGAIYEYGKDNPLTNADPTGTEPLGGNIYGAQQIAEWAEYLYNLG